jgi:Rrf2 family iron-sulfur cluster assembly transcriptional regulator
LRLGRASALGVFAAVHLADHGGDGPVQAREIADALGVPIDYLVKILQQLVRSRILVSTRGPQGGFRLQRPPGDIPLLAIVEAIDGPLDGSLTLQKEVRGKRRAKKSIESALQDVAGYARGLLGETSIRDLQENAR